MQELSLMAYKDLIHQATPLSIEIVDGKISHKVLQLPDGSIVKLFRLKRLLTTGRIVPPANRFLRNVHRLEAHGIPTVAMIASYKIPAIGRTAVHYRFMSGVTLREYCETGGIDFHLAKRLGRFFALLHQKGIYFRSIHFGNMVLSTDHRIGLIDVLDMRFKRKPLNRHLRKRNLRHLFRYDTDIGFLAPVRDYFIESYCTSARLHPSSEGRLRRHFEAYFNARDAQLPITG